MSSATRSGSTATSGSAPATTIRAPEANTLAVTRAHAICGEAVPASISRTAAVRISAPEPVYIAAPRAPRPGLIAHRSASRCRLPGRRGSALDPPADSVATAWTIATRGSTRCSCRRATSVGVRDVAGGQVDERRCGAARDERVEAVEVARFRHEQVESRARPRTRARRRDRRRRRSSSARDRARRGRWRAATAARGAR